MLQDGFLVMFLGYIFIELFRGYCFSLFQINGFRVYLREIEVEFYLQIEIEKKKKFDYYVENDQFFEV